MFDHLDFVYLPSRDVAADVTHLTVGLGGELVFAPGVQEAARSIDDVAQHEPVYPDADVHSGHGGDRLLSDIPSITGADDPDESRDELAGIAAKYEGREQAAVLGPGDAAVFSGHTLHRSRTNRSPTRARRAFVAHYCNARSSVPWDDEPRHDGQMANDRRVLARGSSHLPSARPRFRR